MSTVGFSTFEAKREVKADVSKKGHGILGIEEKNSKVYEDSGSQALVNITNNLSFSQNTTVELSNDVKKWHLSNGKQSRTVLLSTDESETFYVTVEQVEKKKKAVYWVKSSAGVYLFTQQRNVTVIPSLRPLITANKSTEELKFIQKQQITQTTTKGYVISNSYDFDGDSYMETAYTQNNGNIYLIDETGETTKIVESGGRDSPSRYWAGEWQGYGPAVFYSNNSNQDIYYASPSIEPTRLLKTKAKPVVGKGDIDNDGVAEFVFAGGSYGLKYLEPDDSDSDSIPQVHKVGVGAGSNYGSGVGTPADFNGKNGERIPYVDSSNNLQLANTTDTIQIAKSVEKTSPARYNWDKDDKHPEIIYLDKSNEYLKMANYENGGWKISIIYDSNGNKIYGNKYTGVA